MRQEAAEPAALHCGCKLLSSAGSVCSCCRAGRKGAGGLPCLSSECTRMLLLHRGKKRTVISVHGIYTLALFHLQLSCYCLWCLFICAMLPCCQMNAVHAHLAFACALRKCYVCFFSSSCASFILLYFVLSFNFPNNPQSREHISYSSTVYMCEG